MDEDSVKLRRRLLRARVSIAYGFCIETGNRDHHAFHVERPVEMNGAEAEVEPHDAARPVYPDFARFIPDDAVGKRSRMPMTVRAATLNDIKPISRVQAAAGRPAVSHVAIDAAIRDPARVVLVGITDERVVGWAKTHYWDHPDGPALPGHYLGGVTVDPEFRRMGAATALTERRLAWIWERASEAWYVVNARNQASIALHERWRFEEIARASRFHTTSFAGGVGVLLRARLTTYVPGHPDAAMRDERDTERVSTGQVNTE